MRSGTKRASPHCGQTRKEYNRAPPPPTHCFGCDEPFNGETVKYDVRYPVIIENGDGSFHSHVGGFHERCLYLRRDAIMRLRASNDASKPHP